MSLGHFLKTRNATPVRAKVRVRMLGMHLTEAATNKRFMVWMRRKGKSRGTRLVPALGKDVVWDEPITLTVTLYRDNHTGLFHRKRFKLIVICSPIEKENLGGHFGTCEIDVSHSSDLANIPLRLTESQAQIRLSVSLDTDDKQSSLR